MKINRQGIETDKRVSINKFEMILILVFGAIALLAYGVHLTLENRSMIGAFILGILATLIIGLTFWAMQLVSTWLHSTWEQKRFQDNAKENYANLLAQQRVQNEQTRGALMLSDNARKNTPQDEGNYLIFDESAFDEIGGE